jgi:hypothetical protein
MTGGITFGYEVEKFANEGERKTKIIEECRKIEIWLEKERGLGSNIQIFAEIKNKRIAVWAIKNGRKTQIIYM